MREENVKPLDRIVGIWKEIFPYQYHDMRPNLKYVRKTITQLSILIYDAIDTYNAYVLWLKYAVYTWGYVVLSVFHVHAYVSATIFVLNHV